MQTATDEAGRVFREAWITGVRKHFPGEPKPGYVTPWDDTLNGNAEPRQWSTARYRYSCSSARGTRPS